MSDSVRPCERCGGPTENVPLEEVKSAWRCADEACKVDELIEIARRLTVETAKKEKLENVLGVLWQLVCPSRENWEHPGMVLQYVESRFEELQREAAAAKIEAQGNAEFAVQLLGEVEDRATDKGLIATVDRLEKLKDCTTAEMDALDLLWQLVYPGMTDWEYPAMVYRHVADWAKDEASEARGQLDDVLVERGEARREVTSLQNKLSEVEISRNFWRTSSEDHKKNREHWRALALDIAAHVRKEQGKPAPVGPSYAIDNACGREAAFDEVEAIFRSHGHYGLPEKETP